MKLSGFYALSFSAQLPGVGAVIVVNDGVAHGADTQYLYAGTVEQDGDQIKVKLRVRAHAEAAQIAFSKLGGAFNLELEGTGNDIAFCVAGISPLPDSSITVTGHRIGSLDLITG